MSRRCVILSGSPQQRHSLLISGRGTTWVTCQHQRSTAILDIKGRVSQFFRSAVTQNVKCKFPHSDMNSIPLQLLVFAALAKAIPVIDNGVGLLVMFPEEKITDFAVLTGNNLDNLPPDFTICSSVASGAFLGYISPFQLLYQNGKPWITIKVDAALRETTHHQMNIYVSFRLHQIILEAIYRVIFR